MTDYIGSLFDNFKGKIRNPFIGTLISVWFIRNWVIVYAVFNFDNGRTMLWKINFIESYFAKISFWYEFVANVFSAMSALLITFVLLAISRIITDGYYKMVEPFIITRIDKDQIFTKNDKLKLDKKITTLNQKLDLEIEGLARSESINENLRNRSAEAAKESKAALEATEEKLVQSNIRKDSLEVYHNNSIGVFNKIDKIHSVLTPSAFELLKRIDKEPILDQEVKKYDHQAMKQLLSFDLVKIVDGHIAVSEMGKLIFIHASHKSD